MVKLEDYTAVELKKMISSFNKVVKFGAYSKLNKAELIKMMKSHPKIKIQEGANGVKISLVAEQETPITVKEKKEKKEQKPEVAKKITKTQQKAQQAKVIAPVKKEPQQAKVIAPVDGKIKKEIKTILNKHYGEIAKLEQKVLDGKIKDTDIKYGDKEKQLEEQLDEDLYELKEKYNIKNFNNDTEFFENMEGTSKKYINVLKEKSFGGFKSIPNYVKANKIGDKIMEKQKKKEPVVEKSEDKLLNKLVATARSHAKNGISVAGLNDFYSKVNEYKKTNPPKLQGQLAGVLYNFLNKNIQMNKKKLPNNMNNALKELGYKEIKK